jgi:hypothetical protein
MAKAGEGADDKADRNASKRAQYVYLEAVFAPLAIFPELLTAIILVTAQIFERMRKIYPILNLFTLFSAERSARKHYITALRIKQAFLKKSRFGQQKNFLATRTKF